MHTTNPETLIARIALSLWTSERRVERLPVVTEVQPWERATLVSVPESLMNTMIVNRYEGI
jgi:hypothetical protein